MRLDAAETIAVVFAGRTFAFWGGTPLGRTLSTALEKIARFADPAVKLPGEDLKAVLYQSTGIEIAAVRHRATQPLISNANIAVVI